MGYLHCCGALRRSESYSLVPQDGFLMAEMDILEECPVCGHYVVQLTRIDLNNEISFVRKSNLHARKLYYNLKTSILRKQEKRFSLKSQGKSYLCYNEFGKKKRCYSNLSTLKIGLFDNSDKLFASNPIAKIERIQLPHAILS